MRAYGLATHIWKNNTRSLLLMAGFPVLLLLVTYGLFLLYAGLASATVKGSQALSGPFIWAGEQMAQSWPFALIGAGVWFAIAYVFYQGIIDAATGAHEVSRIEEPRLYNLLENLCISRGMKTPALRIIDTDGLNAFATGLHEGQYCITVTRGIMDALNDAELEAVLGHELTHIRNRDVRLLVVAVVFVGIFSFIGQIVFNGLRWGAFSGRSARSSSSSSDRRSSGGAAILAIVVALAIIALSYGLAIVIRFALSRRREFLADAGSVELTKNPDAMISALRKISGHSQIQAPAEVREMFIENTHTDFAGILATHPPIEERIQALIQYAGGNDAAPAQEPAPQFAGPAPAAGPKAQAGVLGAQPFGRRKGPWG